jgi:hypothetical protein
MMNSPWRRVLWLLAALFVCAPAVAALALQTPAELLSGALRSIPAPPSVEIRPRLFIAYGALIATCTLGILYLYRGRAFVVYWIVSWSMLAASYTLNARGYVDVRLGSAMIGLSQLLTVWSAALLLLSVDEFSKKTPHRWDIPVQAGAASAIWFLAAPFALPLSHCVLHGPCRHAPSCKGWASVRFARAGEEDADYRRVHDERGARRDVRARCGGRDRDIQAGLGRDIHKRACSPSTP